MSYSEKCFWGVLGAFFVTVSYGIGYQALFSDAALATTMLPLSLSICAVHLFGHNRPQEVADLWIALLIWIYFPLVVVVGFLTAAHGCDEGFITPDNITSPLLMTLSILIVAAATFVTTSFLRARKRDSSASVMPFVFTSAATQIILGPLLLFAY